jgi:hypothetical protein
LVGHGIRAAAFPGRARHDLVTVEVEIDH